MVQTKLRLEQIEDISAGGGGFKRVYFITSFTSDLIEDGIIYMRNLLKFKDQSGEQSGSTGNTVGTGETKFLTCATAPGEPGCEVLLKGVSRVYITAKQSAGTKSVTVKAKVYKQNTAGTQTLLFETAESTPLTSSYVTYEVSSAESGPFDLSLTDRIVLKLYAVGSSSGTTSTVDYKYGTTTTTPRLELQPSSGVESPGLDGWIQDSSVWTRTSGTTFTISGDVTATYKKWSRVRWKDGSTYKYGVVLSSSYSAPNTTVTLVTNSDYSMSAATITDTYYSYTEQPIGFPTRFTYTSTPTNITVGNGTLNTKYSCFTNGLFTVQVDLVFGSTTSITGTGVSFSTPVTGISLGATMLAGIARLEDASAGTVYQGTVPIATDATTAGATVIVASGTYATNTSITSAVPFTWAVSDKFSIQYMFYGA